MIILEVSNVSKSFGGVKANVDISMNCLLYTSDAADDSGCVNSSNS